MKRLKRRLDTAPTKLKKKRKKKVRLVSERSFQKLKLKYAGYLKYCDLYRLRVPGGWLVCIEKPCNRSDIHMCFVPDANHKWDMEYFKFKQEPEDLRDDWPHAKPVLREAAKYAPPYVLTSKATNTFTTIDLRDTSGGN